MNSRRGIEAFYLRLIYNVYDLHEELPQIKAINSSPAMSCSPSDIVTREILTFLLTVSKVSNNPSFTELLVLHTYVLMGFSRVWLHLIVISGAKLSHYVFMNQIILRHCSTYLYKS